MNEIRDIFEALKDSRNGVRIDEAAKVPTGKDYCKALMNNSAFKKLGFEDCGYDKYTGNVMWGHPDFEETTFGLATWDNSNGKENDTPDGAMVFFVQDDYGKCPKAFAKLNNKPITSLGQINQLMAKIGVAMKEAGVNEAVEDGEIDTELDEARSLFESARADYITARDNYRALLEAKEDEDEDGEDIEEDDDEEDMPDEDDEDDEEVDEKVKKVVRDGKVVKKKVPTHKVILNAKQKAALMKARKKAHTASANRARKKSNKVRDRKGL